MLALTLLYNFVIVGLLALVVFAIMVLVYYCYPSLEKIEDNDNGNHDYDYDDKYRMSTIIKIHG